MKIKLTYTQIIILLCVILFVFFIVSSRSAIRHWTASLNAKIKEIEGMSGSQSKTYRFAPNKNDWQNGVDLTADDVKRETVALFQFFKQRKHLVDDTAGGPSAAERLVASIPKVSPGVQRPQVPQIDFTSLETALKPPEEKANAKSETKTESKSEKKETMSTMALSEEYGSTVIEDQDIYKAYNALKTRETELMDEEFGEYFVAKNWVKPDRQGGSDGMIKTLQIKLEYYDVAYSKVKYNVLQTKEETVFIKNAFTKYFVSLITKYKNSDAKLKQIKQTMYNILRPTYVLNKFYAEFITNSGKYSAKTDALFFVNKCIECLTPQDNSSSSSELNKTDKLSVSPSGAIYTFKDDDMDYSNRDIVSDGLTIADSVLIASFLWRLADANVPHFVMSSGTFLKNYEVFLDKNRERKYPGVYLFMVKNISKLV